MSQLKNNRTNQQHLKCHSTKHETTKNSNSHSPTLCPTSPSPITSHPKMTCTSNSKSTTQQSKKFTKNNAAISVLIFPQSSSPPQSSQNYKHVTTLKACHNLRQTGYSLMKTSLKLFFNSSTSQVT